MLSRVMMGVEAEVGKSLSRTAVDSICKGLILSEVDGRLSVLGWL